MSEPEEPKKIKVRVIGSREQIDAINSNETHVHMTFRPSGKDFIKLINRCPLVKTIYLPKSYDRTVAGFIREFLKMNRIELKIGEVWGHRSDISVYAEIDENLKTTSDIKNQMFNK